MTNIWGFLIQTLSASLVAVILLVIKRLLNDKLSPRWQYGVCSVLAVRILIPVKMDHGMYITLSVWLETIKAMVERNLESEYSKVYVPSTIEHIFPSIQNMPVSLTDWIFVIYTAGVVLSILYYLISWLRLKMLLNRGNHVSLEMQKRIDFVCEKYGLKKCRIVMIRGLTSAFVCAGIRPVLALPYDKEIDEKVILHELLHLKYHDELQTIGWCILRSLHWCNPFLQYVFCQIENDMETLCDQRVLELLEGEERREYGLILLDMANEKYARVPGTSSISNGGKNISRRIKAIVCFKKYPKGMALVSVCIVIVLLSPELFIIGNASGYQYNYRDYHPQKEHEFEKAMALARVNRCTTVAGAIDTYAKGMLYENGIYIATASSLSKHETLVNQMKSYEGPEDVLYRIPTGEKYEWLIKNGYSVYNFVETGEQKYEAYLFFDIVDSFDGTTNSLMVPIRITYEDAWVVEEFGEHIEMPESMNVVFNTECELPGMRQYKGSSEYGEANVNIHTIFYVNNEIQNDNSFFSTTIIDESLKTNAEFDYAWLYWDAAYHLPDTDAEMLVEDFAIQFAALDSIGEEAKYSEDAAGGLFAWIYGIGEDNYTSLSGGQTYDISELEDAIPEAYKARIKWDDKIVEELTLDKTIIEYSKEEM